MAECDCAATTDGKWADVHSHGCAIFKCSGCGAAAYVAPSDGSPAFCPEHCPDHIYNYERGEGWRCLTCYAEPPPDWYSSDAFD